MNQIKSSMDRSYALDALRGFAILTMILSGVIPYRVLPSWMYHAQIPPPTHTFNPNLPGFTWVDLVFPLFLFALGAAIPLALSRRIEKGASLGRILFGILDRGFLLGFFAIFLRHVRPHVISPNPDTKAWLIALLGFLLMFPIFSRLPKSWNPWLKWIIKIGGWAGATLLLINLKYPDGSGFSLYRSDIIIIVLTNAAVFGSLVWLATQKNMLLRLGILGILIAFRLAHTEVGWVKWLWDFSPIPWIYKLYYLQYLFIVIPGTIVGDFILEWMKTSDKNITQESNWSSKKLSLIALTMFLFIITMFVGLQARWLWQTNIITIALCLIGWWLVRNPQNKTEKFLNSLFLWGMYWLILGLVFEPYEGGIKKDHPTLSYYFVTTGLSIFLLLAFTIIIDIFKNQRYLRMLIDNGQNPMIAYVGFANFIWPILALTGLEKVFLMITPTPWLGFIRGLFYTIVLALMVSLFTRRKIFWRT